MILLLQALLQLQFGIDALFDCPQEVCTGSAFSPMAAAMATQGYWAQADIVEFLRFSSFKNLAILFYVCAAAGGLISMALGMPPKLYLWFFMGPALYHFLLATPATSLGNRWEIGRRIQNQSEVWKLAYPGIEGTRAFRNNNLTIQSFDLGGQTLYLPPNLSGDNGAQVAWAFAYFDMLVSSVVQNLVSWFGPYSAVPGSGGNATFSTGDSPWYLLSNLKWGMLETVTSAKFSDAALRDVFVTFLASECGDRFKTAVNAGALAQANTAKGKNLPPSVIWSKEQVVRVTDTYSIPTPFTFAALIRDGRSAASTAGAPGSFLRASRLGENFIKGNDVLATYGAAQSVTCSQLLYAIAVGARWEAGHTYARLMSQAPHIMPAFQGTLGSILNNTLGGKTSPGIVTNALFYGWDLPAEVRVDSGGSAGGFNFNLGGLGSLLGGFNFFGGGKEFAQQQFLINLITAHILRNEFAIAPPVVKSKGTDSEGSKTYADIYTRTVGAKSKFGELYVWALMVPYLQGLFLYFLAIAYPFVCMAMVVPGWHKMFFSWMSFWLWVKLWDVGFAIVMMAERGIWSMLGNSDDAAVVFRKVAEFSNYSHVGVKCTGNTILGSLGAGAQSNPPCFGNQVVDIVISKPGSNALMSLNDAIGTVDLGMLLGASMDLDRANAYYIYLMAAMYFAVPMVAGQLVLGSKAAVAGMVKEFIGGAASEGGRASGSAFTAGQTAAASANAASMSQAATLKGMRQQGHALKAMRAGNLALQRGLESAVAGQHAQGLQAMNQQLGQAQTYNKGSLDIGSAVGRMAFAPNSVISVGTNAAAAEAISRGKMPSNGFGSYGIQSLNSAKDWGNSRMRQIENNKALEGGGADGNTGNGDGLSRGYSGGGQSLMGSSGSYGLPGGSGNFGQLALGTAGIVWSAKGIGDSLMDAAYGPGRLTMEMVGSIGGAELSRGFANSSSDISAWGSQYGLKGFETKGQADGLNMQGDRLQAATQFDAAQSAWLERANYANAVSPTLAAYGVQPGVISPGQKPEDMKGASWLGQLGAAAQNEARFVDSGGQYFSMVGDHFKDLNASYGYDSLSGLYANNKRSVAEMFGQSAAHYGYYQWAVKSNSAEEQARTLGAGARDGAVYTAPDQRKP